MTCCVWCPLLIAAHVVGPFGSTGLARSREASNENVVYPLMPRTPTLRWTIDADPPTEPLAPGEATSIGYCCDDGPIPVSAVTPLSAERLDRLATASSVTGVALGVPFTLDATQLRALAEFRRALLPESY